MTATVHHLSDEPQPAAVAATHEITINGQRRDFLKVPEVAARMLGASDRATCSRVRALIRSKRLFAQSTGEGGQYLIPVDAYIAFQRGETYPKPQVQS